MLNTILSVSPNNIFDVLHLKHLNETSVNNYKINYSLPSIECMFCTKLKTREGFLSSFKILPLAHFGESKTES